MLPGLSSRLSFQKGQWQTEAVLSACKGTNNPANHHIFKQKVFSYGTK